MNNLFVISRDANGWTGDKLICRRGSPGSMAFDGCLQQVVRRVAERTTQATVALRHDSRKLFSWIPRREHIARASNRRARTGPAERRNKLASAVFAELFGPVSCPPPSAVHGHPSDRDYGLCKSPYLCMNGAPGTADAAVTAPPDIISRCSNSCGRQRT